MHHKGKIIAAILLALTLIAVSVWYLSSLHMAILDPKGLIALKERNLLVFTFGLGMIIVIPVFILAILIAWRYRESNTKARYTPNVSTNRIAETIWWGIPILLILILSIVTWVSTYDIDPYKPLASSTKPITIKVVALNWKWLFIYPDEDNIATVNYVQFPVNTPVTFELTADAPMNSFWIPQLSGQLYAMPGMVTKLNLNATESGEYKGSSANISGEGFAGMKFTARASSQNDFNTWVKKVKSSPLTLDNAAYTELVKDSSNNPVALYHTSASELYDTIVMKYMMPDMTTAAPTTQQPPAEPTPTPPTHESDMKGMDMSTMHMGTH